VPAEAAREWRSYRSARCVEVNSPLLLPMGDALIDWLAHLSPAEVPDIVIAGSRGHDSRLARFFLGSVSSYLVQQGEASLLVVRPSAQTAAMAQPLRQPPPLEERGKAPRKVAIALDAAADTARAQIRWAVKYVLHRYDASLGVLRCSRAEARSMPSQQRRGEDSAWAHAQRRDEGPPRQQRLHCGRCGDARRCGLACALRGPQAPADVCPLFFL
jgi:hypothetical protein